MERTCATAPSARRIRTGVPFALPMSPQQYPAADVVVMHVIPSPAVSVASVSASGVGTGAGSTGGGGPTQEASSAAAQVTVTSSSFRIIGADGRATACRGLQ